MLAPRLAFRLMLAALAGGCTITCAQGNPLERVLAPLTPQRSPLAPQLQADAPKQKPNAGHGEAVVVSVPEPHPEATAAQRLSVQPEQPAQVESEEATDAEARQLAAKRALEGPLRGLDPERVLVSTSVRTWIYREPSMSSQKIGYLRTGAVVKRAVQSAGGNGCRGGFYEIEPEGFVCVGRAASLDAEHPLVHAQRTRPDRTQGLPYVYGRSLRPTPPLYTRVPTADEQRFVEQDLSRHAVQAKQLPWERLPLKELPEFLRDGQPSFRTNGTRRETLAVSSGRALRDSGFAFVELFQANERLFGLTTDFEVLPLDRLELVEQSSFQGVELDADMPLPVAFVRSTVAKLYEGNPESGLRIKRDVKYREAFSLSGVKQRVAGELYHETKDGDWLLDTNRLVQISAPKSLPKWAKPGRTWIDVSILKQSLVAYVGERPVYATLVSTGADGLQDPETTHSTIRGQFLIHTKHVTVGMDSDVEGDAFDLRDVPYVQYFTEGYALHAAYWHDSFGAPRSHGCINLSPLDARWLFEWTDPQVPDHWHAAMSLLDGTLISVHP